MSPGCKKDMVWTSTSKERSSRPICFAAVATGMSFADTDEIIPSIISQPEIVPKPTKKINTRYSYLAPSAIVTIRSDGREKEGNWLQSVSVSY